MEVSRAAAITRGVRLEAITIAWMLVEAIIAIGAGVAARSVLLTAFGFDSVVELLSGVVLYRRLSAESARSAEQLERVTTRISALLLILLTSYVVLTSVAGLVLHVMPSGSPLGLGVATAALVAMPLLARAKTRVNDILRSPSLRADIAETISCAYLAAVTLAGLGAAMLFGWWWAQYLAALLLLVWLVPETREALEESHDNGNNSMGEMGKR